MVVNWASWLVWGFGATVILTALMSISHGAGLSRMSIPYMLGTMLTPNRDRAKVYGILMHLVNGWIFSFVYVVSFELRGGGSWWFGALVGLVHGTFVLTVAMPALPAIHRRMASEQQGPTVMRFLEPPGFLGLNYGYQTPLVGVIAHVVFGAILGAFYRPV